MRSQLQKLLSYWYLLSCRGSSPQQLLHLFQNVLFCDQEIVHFYPFCCAGLPLTPSSFPTSSLIPITLILNFLPLLILALSLNLLTLSPCTMFSLFQLFPPLVFCLLEMLRLTIHYFLNTSDILTNPQISPQAPSAYSSPSSPSTPLVATPCQLVFQQLLPLIHLDSF